MWAIFRMLAFHQHGNRAKILVKRPRRTCLELNKNNPREMSSACHFYLVVTVRTPRLNFARVIKKPNFIIITFVYV